MGFCQTQGQILRNWLGDLWSPQTTGRGRRWPELPVSQSVKGMVFRQSDKGMVFRQSGKGMVLKAGRSGSRAWGGHGDQPRRRTWGGGGETQELERLSVPKNAVVGIKDIQTDLR